MFCILNVIHLAKIVSMIPAVEDPGLAGTAGSQEAPTALPLQPFHQGQEMPSQAPEDARDEPIYHSSP